MKAVTAALFVFRAQIGHEERRSHEKVFYAAVLIPSKTQERRSHEEIL